MEDLKNVWNVELDILKKFDSFCKKHGLHILRILELCLELSVIKVLFRGTMTWTL